MGDAADDYYDSIMRQELNAEPPDGEPDDWTPHAYWPDLQAMGDCRICGNIRENCERYMREYTEAQRSAHVEADQ